MSAAAVAAAKTASKEQACQAITNKNTFFTKRRECKILNTPPEFNNSPYVSDAITQDIIQMRRKAEILQYRGPGRPGSIRTGTTRVVNGTRASQYLNYVDACETPIYERTESKYTISTSAGVPGTAMQIIYNPDIKLYNYKQTTGVIVAAAVNSPALDSCYLDNEPVTKLYR